MRTSSHIASRLGLATTCLVGALVIALSGCGPKYPKCDKDEQCASKGELCVEGLCQQCRDDSNCASGQACKGGRCEAKPECSSDGDCKDNKVCRTGKCQTECSQDGDCGSGLKCQQNRCVDQLSCNSTKDCKGGLSCVSGRCSETVSASRSLGCDYPKVHFPFNESTLDKAAMDALERVASCIKERGATVTIEGHCDERGTEEYNLALGDSRANTVRKYLERLGVPSSKLNVVSKGETQPLVQGGTEEAWAENRRAEFIEK